MSDILDYYCLVFLWYFARVLVYIIMPIATFIFVYKFATVEPQKNKKVDTF